MSRARPAALHVPRRYRRRHQSRCQPHPPRVPPPVPDSVLPLIDGGHAVGPSRPVPTTRRAGAGSRPAMRAAEAAHHGSRLPLLADTNAALGPRSTPPIGARPAGASPSPPIDASDRILAASGAGTPRMSGSCGSPAGCAARRPFLPRPTRAGLRQPDEQTAGTCTPSPPRSVTAASPRVQERKKRPLTRREESRRGGVVMSPRHDRDGDTAGAAHREITGRLRSSRGAG